jgi:LmbE family N-acetylglucosaminyl deacetylase
MLSDRRASALLVLMAHPDDVFAIFPWITRALAQGARVECVWLTDGGYGGQDLEPRRRESQQVLAALGVPADAMHFLGQEHAIPDGRLHEQLGKALDAVSPLAARLGSFEILMPAWEGGHQDHDATHLAGLALATRHATDAWEFSLYHGEGTIGSFFRVLSPISRAGQMESLSLGWRERVECVRRCLGYRSQWKSFLGLLPFYALRMLGREAFKRRKAEFALTGQPPHAGKLLYERRSGPSWASFAECTREFRAIQ